MHGLSEHHILLFLIQVLILLGLARGLGELLRRVGQPSLIGDLLVGIVLDRITQSLGGASDEAREQQRATIKTA